MNVKNVIVINDYDYVQGGASLVAIEMANLFNSNGINVLFFCGVSNPNKSLLNKNIKVVSCRENDFLNSKNKFSSMIEGLSSKTTKHIFKNVIKNYDNKDTVIMIHGWTKALSSSFIKLCKKGNFKTVLTGHDYFSVCPNGGLFNYKKVCICHNNSSHFKCLWTNCDSRNILFNFYRRIRYFYQEKINHFSNSINYVLTISNLSKEILVKQFPSSIFYMIYNPTSIEKMPYQNKKSESYFVYVGRIDKEKGVSKLCDEFSNLNEELYIVGDGSELELCKNKQIKNIHFLGWKPHDEVIKIIKKAKCLILPSLWYEGAPLTIFESLSVGTPCIISSVCSAREFVNDNNGYLYNPNNDGELTNLIKSISFEDLQEKSIKSYKMYWDKPFDRNCYKDSLFKFLKSIN